MTRNSKSYQVLLKMKESEESTIRKIKEENKELQPEDLSEMEGFVRGIGISLRILSESKMQYSGSDLYSAELRIKEIEDAVRSLQRDGLKVGLKDGKLFVENTTYTNQNGTDNAFGYAEIDCFADPD